jgi:hypothetical protein
LDDRWRSPQGILPETARLVIEVLRLFARGQGACAFPLETTVSRCILRRARACGQMQKKEIEDLARALAHRNRRRWRTMPERAHPGSDANGGRETRLNRAKIILEAVDTAMITARQLHNRR